MLIEQLQFLDNFYENERTLNGKPVVWEDYDFSTMQEFDRLRNELDSRCVLIRGSHGLGKETAVDAVFPDAPFASVVMALFRSKLSKGLYQGCTIHLDGRMQANGLSRAWIGFKPAMQPMINSKGLGHLRDYTRDSWDYYQWDFQLLTLLIDVNT